MTERRYGSWAGNPKGAPENKARCIVEVFSVRSHQCGRSRGYGPNGEYCKQHDPEAVSARELARSARWAKERSAEKQAANDKYVGARLRETMPDMYDTIRKTRP
jgi:hypothetical protein